MGEFAVFKVIPVGVLETNCYVIGDDGGKGIIIDPGDEPDVIAEAVEGANLDIEYIINTHGHYDHIGANSELKKIFGAELLIHEEDAGMLKNPLLNLSFKRDEEVSMQPDILLKEGMVITTGSISLKVLHTPGHTPGSICLLCDECVFTGDTLFAGSAGRTDLPGGSFEKIMMSIKTKLKTLPEHLKIYPGHGPSSTIGEEKRRNPYM